MKSKLFFVVFFICLTVSNFSQVSVDLTVENQDVVGTDFFFDIFLTRTGLNDLYLGNADLIFIFADDNFDSPTGSKVGPSPGQCTFVPTDQSGLNTLFTRDNYYTNTSILVSGQEIQINLNGPTPADQPAFDTRVARIDNNASTHCLGRFKISGIDHPSGTMDLSWKTSGGGVVTRVFTLGISDPWTSTEATINAIDPPPAGLPVELVSFQGEPQETAIHLNWTTATEYNNYGFDLERKLKGEKETWEKIGFIEGTGNSNTLSEYSYLDKKPMGGSKFIYRLKQIDYDGAFEHSDEIEIELLPATYALYQNYPNPFNPTTTIRFSLMEPQKVSIKLYNSIGEEVAYLINKDYELGYHEIEFNAFGYASGVYYYRIIAGNFIAVNKLLLLK